MRGWSWLEELVRRARDAGVDLTGPGGLLKSLTKLVNGDRAGGGGEPRTVGSASTRCRAAAGATPATASASETVLTDAAGAVEISWLVDGRARDRDGTLRAGHRASCGSAAWCDVDTVRTGVIGLASWGLTIGEISAHFAEGVRRVGRQGHHHPRSRGLVLDGDGDVVVPAA